MTCPAPHPWPEEAGPPSRAAYICKTLDGVITHWDDGAQALLGFSAEEVIGHPVARLVPPGYWGEQIWIRDRILRGQPIRHLETCRIDRNGHLVDLTLQVSPLRDDSGQIIGLAKTVMRTSSQHATLARMRREAGRLARTFHSAPLPLAITRLSDGMVLEVNDLFGEPADRLRLLTELLQQGRLRNYPVSTRATDGTARELLFTAELLELAGQPCLLTLSHDVTALHDVERLLHRRDREFEDIVETAMDAIISIDQHHRICLFNRAAQNMFGVTAEEVMGQPLDRFIPDKVRPNHFELVQSFVDGGEDARRMGIGRVVHGLRADGSIFPMEASISRVGHGESLRITVVARDATALREAEKARMAADAAESANRAKTDFLSRMSHELRTPLNAVLGFAQLLLSNQKEPLTEGQTQQVEQVQQAGWHLLALINDVLDLSRVESGSLPVEPQPLAPVDVLQEALQMARPQAQVRQIELYRLSAPSILPVVQADPLRLRQVLLNLIGNAIKYNRPGGWVRVSAEADIVRGQVSITVADNGLGMSPEQLTHLYEPFNRLGRERSNVEGTGIGLLLSRELVRLMKGELTVQSTAGQGTTIALTLPMHAQAATAPVAGATPYVGGARGTNADANWGGTVLYIEDNPVNQLLMEQLLSRCPTVTLHCEETGAQSLEWVRHNQPDLVLLDMQLPDMNGLEWMAKLRTQFQAEAREPMPVIAVSASAMPDDMQQARIAGVADYWTKPLILDQVVHDLSRWLRHPDTSAPSPSS
jgi:PAS domain S-box-containing protein